MIDMFYGIDQLIVSQVHTYIQIHQIVYIKHMQLKKILFILYWSIDGDCSHEIKRRLLLGRKIMSNLDSILECKEIKLANPKENQS